MVPELNLYDSTWPIWTYQEQMPPAKFVFDDDDRRGTAVDSMVSGGCVISGATVRRSLLFTDVRIESRSVVEDSVVLPNVRVGNNVVLKRVVIDRGCEIKEGMEVGVDVANDRSRFHVTENGITLITPEMLAAEHLRRAMTSGPRLAQRLQNDAIGHHRRCTLKQSVTPKGGT